MSQEVSPVDLDGVIARSRSRYKGGRSNQNVTSPQAPPKTRPDLLEHSKVRPQNERDIRDLNISTGTEKLRATPSNYHAEVTRDRYDNGTTALPTSRPSVTSPDLLSQRARTFPEDKPIPNQTKPIDSQRRVEMPRMTRSGQSLVQQQTIRAKNGEQGKGLEGRSGSQELSAGQRVPRKEQMASIEEIEKSGHWQAGESQGQSFNWAVNSPPMPSNDILRERRPSQNERVPVSNKPSTLQKRSLTHRRKASNVRDELKRSISAPMPVEPPEVSNKPAFDAPVSAVNAGDRRIRVQLDETPLSIAVTPSTTPLDILSEAGSQLSMPLDATMNVLMECFKQLGLERPLRRYERIRDVMNSWDSDSQNSLSIVPSPTGGKDDDLDLTSVTSNQPGDTSVHIYHSNSPGSWEKRWITLRSDGQVLMSKKDGKETVNICHLSDFDIYVPTKRQLAKKIRPPKKYCFAVKSQQKSAMFLSTENFVHFFAAADRELAMAWYKAVQGWRSWYLVHVLGEGQKSPETSVSQRPTNGFQFEVSHRGAKSLIDSANSQHIAGSGQTQQVAQNSSPKRIPTGNHGKLPTSLPKKLTKDATSGTPTTRNDAHYRASIIQHQPLVAAEPEPFAASSLLGRSYTQRQKAVARASNEKGPEYGPSAYSVGNASAPGSNGLQRLSTQRAKQKPLLDLTPKHQEPPQHRKKGIGFIPGHLPVGGLVEAATNTDPTVTNPLETRGGSARKPSAARNQQLSNEHPTASMEKHEPAFTGGLLYSTEKQGQDGAGTGHGVRTGDRAAKEPLLDMTMEGPWAKGSLLDRVNSGESGSGPPVDREKRLEMIAPVGEGM